MNGCECLSLAVFGPVRICWIGSQGAEPNRRGGLAGAVEASAAKRADSCSLVEARQLLSTKERLLNFMIR